MSKFCASHLTCIKTSNIDLMTIVVYSGALQTNMVSTATCLINCIFIIAAETNRTLAVIISRRVNKLYFFILIINKNAVVLTGATLCQQLKRPILYIVCTAKYLFCRTCTSFSFILFHFEQPFCTCGIGKCFSRLPK